MDEHNGSAEMPLVSQGRHGTIKCGWLRKQGGFVKTWHTRWFVLKGDQLYYFKDEDEIKPLVSDSPKLSVSHFKKPFPLSVMDSVKLRILFTVNAELSQALAVMWFPYHL